MRNTNYGKLTQQELGYTPGPKRLLQLIEDTEDIDDILHYQIQLMNHYLKTNQLDKRKAVYAEYTDLVKAINCNLE